MLLARARGGETAEEGFPPSVTGPERTQERLRELASEMSRIANLHGPDAVTLQVGLLTQTIRCGGVAQSEVAVLGPSPRAGPSYLEIVVVSGMIFAAETTTLASRFNTLWAEVAAPALAAMERFQTDPPNLALVLECGVQPLDSLGDRRPDPAAPYRRDRFRIELDAAALAELSAKQASTEDLLAGARVLAGERLLTPRPSTEP